MVIDDSLNEEDIQCNLPSVDDDQVTNPLSEVDDRRMSLRDQQYKSEWIVRMFPPTLQLAANEAVGDLVNTELGFMKHPYDLRNLKHGRSLKVLNHMVRNGYGVTIATC